MAANCEFCGKRRMVGNQISHSNIKTKRVQRPNLQRVHALIEGRPRHIRVCTRCLRSGKVVKAMTASASA
jgi:large subunit ribosomal protein L28